MTRFELPFEKGLPTGSRTDAIISAPGRLRISRREVPLPSGTIRIKSVEKLGDALTKRAEMVRSALATAGVDAPWEAVEITETYARNLVNIASQLTSGTTDPATVKCWQRIKPDVPGGGWTYASQDSRAWSAMAATLDIWMPDCLKASPKRFAELLAQGIEAVEAHQEARVSRQTGQADNEPGAQQAEGSLQNATPEQPPRAQQEDVRTFRDLYLKAFHELFRGPTGHSGLPSDTFALARELAELAAVAPDAGPSAGLLSQRRPSARRSLLQSIRDHGLASLYEGLSPFRPNGPLVKASRAVLLKLQNAVASWVVKNHRLAT